MFLMHEIAIKFLRWLAWLIWNWFLRTNVFIIWYYQSSYAKSDTKIKVDLYYFQKNRFFVWKIENVGELQLPQSIVFFAEIWHTFFT